jgi:hypothetical protein
MSQMVSPITLQYIHFCEKGKQKHIQAQCIFYFSVAVQWIFSKLENYIGTGNMVQ